MGSFDTIRFIDVTSEDMLLVPACAAGHHMADVQTKDFDPDENTQYVVWHGVLYKIVAQRDPVNEAPTLVDNDLIIKSTSTTRYKRLHDTVSVRAYTHCDQCLPVLFETNGYNWRGDVVTELEPWCEWELKFEKGHLLELEPIRVESRADVAKKNHTIERAHIPDTDRIAVRHFERTAEHRANVRRVRGR